MRDGVEEGRLFTPVVFLHDYPPRSVHVTQHGNVTGLAARGDGLLRMSSEDVEQLWCARALRATASQGNKSVAPMSVEFGWASVCPAQAETSPSLLAAATWSRCKSKTFVAHLTDASVSFGPSQGVVFNRTHSFPVHVVQSKKPDEALRPTGWPNQPVRTVRHHALAIGHNFGVFGTAIARIPARA